MHPPLRSLKTDSLNRHPEIAGPSKRIFSRSYRRFIGPRLTGSESFLVSRKLNNLTSVTEEHITIVRPPIVMRRRSPIKEYFHHLLSAKRSFKLLKEKLHARRGTSWGPACFIISSKRLQTYIFYGWEFAELVHGNIFERVSSVTLCKNFWGIHPIRASPDRVVFPKATGSVSFVEELLDTTGLGDLKMEARPILI